MSLVLLIIVKRLGVIDTAFLLKILLSILLADTYRVSTVWIAPGFEGSSRDGMYCPVRVANCNPPRPTHFSNPDCAAPVSRRGKD